MARHHEDVDEARVSPAAAPLPPGRDVSAGHLAARAADLKHRLSQELEPEGLLQEIVVSALAHDAAGIELGMAVESASWEFAAKNAKVIEVFGEVTADKSTLVTAMSSDHVARASRYRLLQERAFFSALKTWNSFNNSAEKLKALSLFANEDACVTYLTQWQEDRLWLCPACGGHHRWFIASRGKYECRCGQQHSIREGTIYARSHTPLLAWFDLTTALVVNPRAKAIDLAEHIRMVRLATIRKMIKKVTEALAEPDGEQQLAGLPAYVELHLRKVYGPGTSLSASHSFPRIDDYSAFSDSSTHSQSPNRPR